MSRAPLIVLEFHSSANVSLELKGRRDGGQSKCGCLVLCVRWIHELAQFTRLLLARRLIQSPHLFSWQREEPIPWWKGVLFGCGRRA